jgi:hypothetical protein
MKRALVAALISGAACLCASTFAAQAGPLVPAQGGEPGAGMVEMVGYYHHHRRHHHHHHYRRHHHHHFFHHHHYRHHHHHHHRRHHHHY